MCFDTWRIQRNKAFLKTLIFTTSELAIRHRGHSINMRCYRRGWDSTMRYLNFIFPYIITICIALGSQKSCLTIRFGFKRFGVGVGNEPKKVSSITWMASYIKINFELIAIKVVQITMPAWRTSTFSGRRIAVCSVETGTVIPAILTPFTLRTSWKQK